MHRLTSFIVSLALTLLVAVPALAKEVNVGFLIDLSGPTSDVGQPYSEGVTDCVKWLNDTGYIPGHTIKLHKVDYAYNAQRAISAYKRFTNRDDIVALQGWGTQDTEALTRFIARDKIPSLSASYSAHLSDPSAAPYNFFIAADYSTQIRGALKYFKDSWAEDRAPRVAFVYPDHPYGLAPIPAAKKYAEEIGFEIVGEENVGLRDLDATTQLLSLKSKNPDYVWVGGTTPSTAVVLKDAAKLGMETTIFSNIWGIDETIFKLAPGASEGAISLQAAVAWGADVPGMKVMEELTGGEPRMTHYVRGFASMLVMAEGIKRAAAAGTINGPAIKDALETLRDFDPMGLTPPISFFPDDHRPNMSVYLYKVQGDTLVKQALVTLPRKAEWLGH